MRQFYYIIQTLSHGRGANFVKIVSLALGLLITMYLFAHIAVQLSYDKFYKEPDKLCKVYTGWLKNGKLEGRESVYTIHRIPGTIAEAFPDRVQSATACSSLVGNTFSIGDKKIQLNTVAGDTLYFATLGLEVLEGNPQDLANPDMVFLSETAARQLFGGESPVGKTITYHVRDQKIPMLVRGVFRDIPLTHSLNKPSDAVVSFSCVDRYYGWVIGWNGGGNFDGYVRLRQADDLDWLNERLSATIARYIPPERELELSVRLVPIRDIHLNNSNVRRSIYMMLCLSVILLLTTALNYVLSSISSLTGRAKAIGVHKCNGADAGDIYRMFMLETAVVVLLALALAAGLIYFFREPAEQLTGIPLQLLFAPSNLYAPSIAIVLLFLIGGCLPAMVFSRIPVTQVFQRVTARRSGWKNALLVVQFAGAAFFIGMMVVVVMQYCHVLYRDRGWNPERVAYVNCYSPNVNREQLYTHLRNLPYVEAQASSQPSCMGFIQNRPIHDAQGNELFHPRNGWFDKDFVPFIGLKLKEGRNLTGDRQLLVNGPFCRMMGWTDSPIGKQVDEYGTVVGLLDRFAYPSGPDDMDPIMVEWCEGVGPSISVKLKEPFEENLRRLNEEMKQTYPQVDLQFESMEQWMFDSGKGIRMFGNILLIATVAILFITLMGIMGYVNDEIRLRSKEIAIRKVNGAESWDILRLLSKAVSVIAVPSVVAGIVGAYYAGRMWLSNFSDVVSQPIAVYVLLALFVVLLIISVVVMKAWHIANEDPVRSIKNE